MRVNLAIFITFKEHLPGFGLLTVFGSEYVASAPLVIGESKEKVLVFKGVIAAHMFNQMIINEGTAQSQSLIAITCVSFIYHPRGHIGGHKALRVGFPVV